LRFELITTDPNTQARLGKITTAHGEIATPVFMPVGTAGTVKAISQQELKTLGAEIILGNTYHLYLRPGHQLIHELGGLHRFISWDRPMLTDSGGFSRYSAIVSCVASLKTVSHFGPILTAPLIFSHRRKRLRFNKPWVPISSWHSMSAPPIQRIFSSQEIPWNAPCAGPIDASGRLSPELEVARTPAMALWHRQGGIYPNCGTNA
jgi:hypothetical protein